jgi:hypothetical protein
LRSPARHQGRRVERRGAFVDARLQIINDPTASAGDRLRAMEQLESRALGKPKETVEQVNEEPEFVKELRALTVEQRRQLLRAWTAEASPEH